MNILGLLVVVLLLCLAYWAMRQIMGAFAIPKPIETVVTVLFVVIAVLWIVQALSVSPLVPRFR